MFTCLLQGSEAKSYIMSYASNYILAQYMYVCIPFWHFKYMISVTQQLIYIWFKCVYVLISVKCCWYSFCLVYPYYHSHTSYATSSKSLPRGMSTPLLSTYSLVSNIALLHLSIIFLQTDNFSRTSLKVVF